jgi:hypothetical protein
MKTWIARCTLARGLGPCLHWSDALKSLTASLSNLATLHGCMAAWLQSCPRVILCRETRQIYTSSTSDGCLTVSSRHACGDGRVSQPGEWYMCRTFHVCDPTPPTANRCSSMRDIALLGCGPHYSATLPLCWTLQPSSLRCAQSAHRCRFRPCSDLTPASRSLLTHELLQIPLP